MIFIESDQKWWQRKEQKIKINSEGDYNKKN